MDIITRKQDWNSQSGLVKKNFAKRMNLEIAIERELLNRSYFYDVVEVDGEEVQILRNSAGEWVGGTYAEFAVYTAAEKENIIKFENKRYVLI